MQTPAWLLICIDVGASPKQVQLLHAGTPSPTTHLAHEDSATPMGLMIWEGRTGSPGPGKPLPECEVDRKDHRFAAVIYRAQLAQLPSALLCLQRARRGDIPGSFQ